MVDEEVVAAGLAALSVAIGEIMEATVDIAVGAVPRDRTVRLERMTALTAAGQDIAVLARAGEVLIRRCESESAADEV